MNEIVHCKIEPYDIYIGRGSKWGNPFTHKEGTKADFIVSSVQEAVDRYRDFLIAEKNLIDQIHTLDNKVLGCWCKSPTKRNALCHGDILVEVCAFLRNKKPVYVFGSNLAGRHGRGSAKLAVDNWGAKYGVGYGPTGYSYAIPTKDKNIQTLPIDIIKLYVDAFIDHAKENPGLGFLTVKIGCGLAGYKEEEIIPLFANCPENVLLPRGWRS